VAPPWLLDTMLCGADVAERDHIALVLLQLHTDTTRSFTSPHKFLAWWPREPRGFLQSGRRQTAILTIRVPSTRRTATWQSTTRLLAAFGANCVWAYPIYLVSCRPTRDPALC